MYLKHLIFILICFSITSLSMAQCPNTDIFFSTQADIDNFSTNYPGCTMIPAGVNVFINDGTGSITNLNGLSGITSIGENLFILANGLTNINGLSSLTSVGEALSISNNDALTNLDGLSALTSVGGNIDISYNAVLANIDGLLGLTSIGGNLFIDSNDALTNLDGLSSLTSIGGELFIYANATLTNIDGLSALTSLGQLFIASNPALTNIDALSGLTSLGGPLVIDSNDALTNLDALSGLTSIGGFILITNNDQLNMCCALCPLLQEDNIDDTVVGDFIDISGNAIGCDEADIRICSPCEREDVVTVSDEVPTVGEWGLIILCLMMLITCVAGIRQRLALETTA